MITEAVLRAIAPKCAAPKVHVEPLNAAALRYDIRTPERLAMWLAQLAHESAQFNRLEENLSYSAARLMGVFPVLFRTYKHAQEYERQPEKLANYVYADKNRGPRSKLGNDAEGDGWKYRGRGYIQITGKYNYRTVGQALDLDLVSSPDLAAQPDIAARIAGYFWKSRGCNSIADRDDEIAFAEVTRKINPGMEGWAQRKDYWKRATLALA